jgi:nicotinamidase-related amidase
MLKIAECGLLVVDVQGKLARMVEHSEQIIANTEKLIKCSQKLDLPIVCLEQNPAGLGKTVPELAELLPANVFYEKHHFNGLQEPTIRDAVTQTGRTHWLVAGIEAHICVYQTVLGLLQQHLTVSVVSDCISSRVQTNIDLALNNMQNHSVNITSVEMAVYELLSSSRHGSFKEILNIIK